MQTVGLIRLSRRILSLTILSLVILRDIVIGIVILIRSHLQLSTEVKADF